MYMTIVIGIATTIPFTLALLFSTTSLDDVSASYLPIVSTIPPYPTTLPTPSPQTPPNNLKMEVYSQALSSRPAAAFFTFWILFIYFGATIALVLTSGRLLWAFARDNGLPFSRFFAKTHPTLQVPVNATLLTAVFCILYGLIYIGSTTAFNSFVATAILSLNLTYAIPQFILLLRGRSVLPARPFDLGPRFGPFCNIFATAWVSLYAVLFCFPIFLPVTVETMNYVSVVMVGTTVFIVAIWWLPRRLGGKREVFTGPRIGREGLEILSRVNRGELGRESLEAVRVREGEGAKGGN